MTSHYRSIDVRPISTALGAEISGVDLSKPVDGEQMAELRQAYAEFGVIFFRDQALTPEQHLAFARNWGEINVNRFFKPVEGHPMIAEVRKEPDQEKNIGAEWHTDHSYDVEPAMGSILYAREVPGVGGDTLFASMAGAYEALSDGMKAMLEDLKAVHSSRHVFGQARAPEYRGRIGAWTELPTVHLPLLQGGVGSLDDLEALGAPLVAAA